MRRSSSERPTHSDRTATATMSAMRAPTPVNNRRPIVQLVVISHQSRVPSPEKSRVRGPATRRLSELPDAEQGPRRMSLRDGARYLRGPARLGVDWDSEAAWPAILRLDRRPAAGRSQAVARKE